MMLEVTRAQDVAQLLRPLTNASLLEKVNLHIQGVKAISLTHYPGDLLLLCGQGNIRRL
jgi:hypothetical protein